MAKIAVVKTGGKQYKVEAGQTIKVEKLEVEAGQKVKLDTLLVAEGEKLEIGQPSLGEKVEATVISNGRHPKITVVKYKSKTRYKRTLGHRQHFTALKIESIA